MSGSLSCRACVGGTVRPSLRHRLQLRFEAALVLPYTLTDSHTKKKKKNTVTPRPGCAMNINGGSSFWAHSTKQTVRNVHAWLRSTWPTPYIQFNGIMNTQYKGIVHDTKLLCTMQDLCHWFLLLQGAIFLVAVSSGVSVTFQQVTLTAVWIIPVIKTEMALTQDRKMAAMCEILWVNIFLH